MFGFWLRIAWCSGIPIKVASEYIPEHIPGYLLRFDIFSVTMVKVRHKWDGDVKDSDLVCSLDGFEVVENRKFNKISAILHNKQHSLHDYLNSGRLDQHRHRNEQYRMLFVPTAITLYNSSSLCLTLLCTESAWFRISSLDNSCILSPSTIPIYMLCHLRLFIVPLFLISVHFTVVYNVYTLHCHLNSTQVCCLCLYCLQPSALHHHTPVLYPFFLLNVSFIM